MAVPLIPVYVDENGDEIPADTIVTAVDVVPGMAPGRLNDQPDRAQLRIEKIKYSTVRRFVVLMHRHAWRPPAGFRACFGVYSDYGLHGVASTGRPVNRHMQDRDYWEVDRVCTAGTPNTCSMLYAACVKAAKTGGASAVITYTNVEESGASLRASNFQIDTVCPPRRDRWHSDARPRRDDGETDTYQRIRWIHPL